jgi:hypothetical protein
MYIVLSLNKMEQRIVELSAISNFNKITGGHHAWYYAKHKSQNISKQNRTNN